MGLDVTVIARVRDHKAAIEATGARVRGPRGGAGKPQPDDGRYAAANSRRS